MAPLVASTARDLPGYPQPGGPDHPMPTGIPPDEALSSGAITGIVVASLLVAFMVGSFIWWAIVVRWERRGHFSIHMDDLVSGRATTGDGASAASPGWRDGRHPAAAAPLDGRHPPATHGHQTIPSPSRRRSYRQTSIIDMHHGRSHSAALITVPEDADHWGAGGTFPPIVNYVSFSAFHNPNPLSRISWGPPPPYQSTLPTIPSAHVANHVQATSHHGAYHSDVSNINESTEEDDTLPLFTNRRGPTPRHAVGVVNSGVRPSH